MKIQDFCLLSFIFQDLFPFFFFLRLRLFSLFLIHILSFSLSLSFTHFFLTNGDYCERNEQ